jgi:hypothetical protein
MKLTDNIHQLEIRQTLFPSPRHHPFGQNSTHARPVPIWIWCFDSSNASWDLPPGKRVTWPLTHCCLVSRYRDNPPSTRILFSKLTAAFSGVQSLAISSSNKVGNATRPYIRIRRNWTTTTFILKYMTFIDFFHSFDYSYILQIFLQIHKPTIQI